MSVSHLCNICFNAEGIISCPKKCSLLYCSECYLLVKNKFEKCGQCQTDLFTEEERIWKDKKNRYWGYVTLIGNILLFPYYIGSIIFTTMVVLVVIFYPIDILYNYVLMVSNVSSHQNLILYCSYICELAWFGITIRNYFKLISWIDIQLTLFNENYPKLYKFLSGIYILVTGCFVIDSIFIYQIKQ